MSYDPEKYRDKREKVLGIKKRGLGFGTIALIVSTVIILGLGVVTVPQAVSYMATRHLDDAIFKLESELKWPPPVLDGVNRIDGVRGLMADKHDTRLVVTFDRRTVTISQITAVFGKHNLTVTLLNQVNHRQHQNTMKKEAKEYETS
jgi:hypothetical protein